jgi:hypothetical protein
LVNARDADAFLKVAAVKRACGAGKLPGRAVIRRELTVDQLASD